MQVVNFTEARNNLKAIFDIVVHNSEEVIVNRKNGENIVILSLEKYNSIDETESKANAVHLRASIASLNEESMEEDWICT
jgi:antitoxin YefM